MKKSWQWQYADYNFPLSYNLLISLIMTVLSMAICTHNELQSSKDVSFLQTNKETNFSLKQVILSYSQQ